ncbi:MAG TPA: FAD-binding oxidoreductase, partial [bacterium]|nr:FAD-binding oxidoreductase [bacterium]
MFQTVDDRTIAALAEIVGESRIRTDPEALEEYGRDETPGLFSAPGAAVFPADALQIARILELAARENVPVTARGGGTGLAGGAVPSPGGIVLALTGMDRLVEIDEENLTATVEPGMVTERFRDAVEAVGLYYPPDPASLDSCTIGGNLATGAGGARALRYGTTRDYVVGLEAVVPAAGTVAWGGKSRKNASGYNLAQLLVGSEGTLGVIVKAVLRLLPLPPERVTLWASFPDLERAAAAVAPLLKSGADPAALELMDRGSLEAAARIEDAGLGRGGEAFLLIELEGRGEVELPWEETGKICAEAGAADVLVAEDRGLRDRVW